MSQSVWGYWLIALGIGVITIMMLVQNYTTINQEDYYLLKEVTQAAMNDTIDFNHYRQYNELKINREKFIENFVRRFSESVKGICKSSHFAFKHTAGISKASASLIDSSIHLYPAPLSKEFIELH